MKEKNIKIVFFIIIIAISIFSAYYIVDNRNILARDIKHSETEEKVNKNIIIGITQFDTINPITSMNQDMQYVIKLIYDPLINITEKFELTQGLASEWAQLDDKTYLIRLNEEKYWHDGKKFKAQDVEYTFKNIKENNSIYSNNVKNIESIEIINDYTIKIHLSEKEDYFEYMLCFPIVCERPNIGTGEFVFTKINENEINLKNKNNNKQVLIKSYSSPLELYNAFNNGEVEIITTTNIDYEKYIGQIGYNKNMLYGRKFDYLKINSKNRILEDTAVLQAIELAINKNEIVYKNYNNAYLPAEFPLQYGSYLYKNNIMYEYNINKAQKILEEAGWKYTRKAMG